MQNLNAKVLAGIILTLGGCAHGDKTAQKSEKPNIIYILADDLGYGDLGCYGQKMIKTPNLDKMASEGIRFTQFYAGSTVCAPSRCTLMTGLHTGHAYIRGNIDGVGLRPSDTTLTQVLKRGGYVTGMFGKWGLGNAGSPGDPAVKGWDAFTGYTDQVRAHFYYQDSINRIVDGKTVNVPIDSTRYSYDYVIDDALKFIRGNKDRTFFAYLPVRLPHAALIAPEEDLRPYLDANGNSIFKEVPYPGGEFKPNDKPYAEYAAMITRLDGDVGRILKLLKDLGIDKNTIVLFASDNGADEGYSGHKNDYFHDNGPLRGIKRDLYEGGIRVPMIAWGPGTIPAGQVSDVVWAHWDLAPTFCDFALVPFTPPTDGISFRNALTGTEQSQQHDFIYFEFGVPWYLKYMQSVRKGDWKLIRTKRNILPEQYELYNLADDIGETTDLSTKHPERVRELAALMMSAHRKPDLSVFDYSFMPATEAIPPAAIDNASGKAGGFTATYYKGKDFETPVRTETDSAVNFEWAGGSPEGLPEDGFSIRWTGKIDIPQSGTYHFYTAADDGVRLWVNGKRIIDDWNAHGVQIHDGEIRLEKGRKAAVRLDYFENVGGAEVHLSWKRPE